MHKVLFGSLVGTFFLFGGCMKGTAGQNVYGQGRNNELVLGVNAKLSCCLLNRWKWAFWETH